MADQANPPALAQVQWGTTIQDGPDGTKWVGVQINVPLGAFVVGMPADLADDLANQLPRLLRETAKEARRLNGGLVLAPADALAALRDRKER